jgi:hypothetical protein
MVPVGWTTMECPKTKEVQQRKVAKIIQDRNVEYWHKRNLGETAKSKDGKETSKNKDKSKSSKKRSASSGEDSDMSQ